MQIDSFNSSSDRSEDRVIEKRPCGCTESIDSGDSLTGVDTAVYANRIVNNNVVFTAPVPDFTDLPAVVDGMLTFRDADHFDSYYYFLENTSNFHAQGATSMSQKDFYVDIEKQVGFTSLRNVTEEMYQRSQNSPNPISILDTHFIKDMLFKSFLNPNGEVSIGGKITRFINNNLAVTTDARNANLVNTVRRLPFTATKSNVMPLAQKFPNDFQIDDWSVKESRKTYMDYNGSSANQNRGVGNTFESAASVKPNSGTALSQRTGVGNTYDPAILIRQNGGPVNNFGNSGIGIDNTGQYSGTFNDVRNNFRDFGTVTGDENNAHGSNQYSGPFNDVRNTFHGYGTVTIDDKPTVSQVEINGGITPSIPDPCHAPFTIRLENVFLRFGPLHQKYQHDDVHFQILWGDMTAGNYNTDNTGSIFTTPTHAYTSGGVKTITINAYPSSGGTVSGGLLATTTFNYAIGCYIGESRESGSHENVRADGYRKVIGNNWVQQWNVGTHQKSRTGAVTVAQHWEKDIFGHWGWRDYTAKRVIVSYAITKYDPGSCSISSIYDVFAGPWGQNYVEQTATQDGHFGWFQLNSHHEVLSYDSWPPVTLDLVTKVC